MFGFVSVLRSKTKIEVVNDVVFRLKSLNVWIFVIGCNSENKSSNVEF